DSLSFARDGRQVLEVSALTVASGRVTALLGPNGGGKSTLLRLVAGLDRPSSGSVSIGGGVVRSAREMRGVVAIAFQEPVFFAGSVRANLELGLELRGVPRGQWTSRARTAAQALGIESLLERSAHRLSGGEAQRANLARALVLRAPITLLDEPLSGLDAQTRQQLMFELPGLLADSSPTTILVTHDREEAMRLASDVVILIDGRVRAAGTVGSVFRAPPDHETAVFLGFTILPVDSETVAVPPGGLQPGPGSMTFEMTVTSAVDTGSGWEVAGTIADVPVRLLWNTAPPLPGSRAAVSWSPRDD
ncbi:MAG: ATP-binding cassette domain-containing protein, partial [Tepidiformaceae bacterium]